MIHRRDFLVSLGSLAMSGWAGGAATTAPSNEFHVQTVMGPVPVTKLGPTLPHEHVMCDFIGAEETGRHRWEVDKVVRRMKPVLMQLKERGITGFIDCTPAYIGRDPRVLKQLAEATGLHIVTNTGYYGGAGDKYVPRHAYEESADRLAERWVNEWTNGIEESGIKPGFMKIGVDAHRTDPSRLSDIDDKLVRASARAFLQTGLTVVCHTGGGPAGLAAAKRFVEEKGDPARFVVAHADGHGLDVNRQVADLGAWVSFDGISRRPLAEHLEMVKAMVKDHPDSLLLSHDNGWYSVGEENGGEVRDYNFLSDRFVPALRDEGFGESLIRRLTVDNPARAFGGVR